MSRMLCLPAARDALHPGGAFEPLPATSTTASPASSACPTAAAVATATAPAEAGTVATTTAVAGTSASVARAGATVGTGGHPAAHLTAIRVHSGLPAVPHAVEGSSGRSLLRRSAHRFPAGPCGRALFGLPAAPVTCADSLLAAPVAGTDPLLTADIAGPSTGAGLRMAAKIPPVVRGTRASLAVLLAVGFITVCRPFAMLGLRLELARSDIGNVVAVDVRVPVDVDVDVVVSPVPQIGRAHV